MTTELYWMTLTLLMTALCSVPYVLDRIVVRGLWPTLADPKPASGGEQSTWAQRAMHAHANAIENLAIFAPAVLAAHVLGISTPLTKLAALVYFVSRLVHYIVYTAGIPVLRTLAFAGGLIAQLVFIAHILKWM
jgi:uncharacterized MAPEG superfamily protein